MPRVPRYHVHICLVRNENPELENALQLALSDAYFLTWDLIGHPESFMEYSRAQIDGCDYVLLILGDGYGHLSPSGVSFLHLSYIYATTKRKPIVALVKNQQSTIKFTRQRMDFDALIQSSRTPVVLYSDSQEAALMIQSSLSRISHREPRLGWQRVEKMDSTLSQNTGLLPKAVLTVEPVVPVNDKDNGIVVSPQSAPMPQPVELTQSIVINYSAHAYQGGNLRNLMATHSFSWGEILTLLKSIEQPFSSSAMRKQLNDSLKEVALIEASKTLPNVHAVSRCQINTKDFQVIKDQLIHHQWLLKYNDARMARELWQINPKL